jgi:hypothetical protein
MTDNTDICYRGNAEITIVLKMMIMISGPKKDEVTGGWRKLHNEELHNLNSSPNIIRTIKSRIKWAGHVERMGRRGMDIGFWWESRRGRNHQQDLDVGGRIILKWISARQDAVVWTVST